MIKRSIDKGNNEEYQRPCLDELLPLAVTPISLVKTLDFLDAKDIEKFGKPAWFQVAEASKALFVRLNFNAYESLISTF